MDFDNIIAHWSGKFPEGFVRPPLLGGLRSVVPRTAVSGGERLRHKKSR